MSEIKKDSTMGHIPITHPYMPPEELFLSYARRLWETRWLTHGGPLVREFQEKLCEKLEVPHTVVFSNGHMALDCAMKALGLHDGEAITTPYTYISTANALAMNGLRPVFCDVKASDGTLDETKIEALITERTKVIVPVHVYGFPCNYRAIEDIARRHGLKVVYDAAHAFGMKVDGRGIGTLGDASMFSFHATKVFHSAEGGAVTFNDPALESRLVEAKNFGMTGPEQADSISFNAKMTDLHAAMGLANLHIVDMQIEKRRELIEHYLAALSDMDEIELFHWDKPNVTYNYAYFPICVRKGARVGRDDLAERMQRDYDIQVRKYFYPLLSDLHCYSQWNDSADTSVAKDLSDRVLTLPLFVELTHEQVDYICEAIHRIMSGGETGV